MSQNSSQKYDFFEDFLNVAVPSDESIKILILVHHGSMI